MKQEIFITRCPSSARHYNVTLADFEKGNYKTLAEHLTFDQARDKIQEITGAVDEEYLDNVSPVLDPVF